MSTTSSATQRNVNITAMVASLNGGRLVFTDASDVVLATLTLSNPAASVTGAVATFLFVADEVNGAADGTIAKAWFQDSSQVTCYTITGVATSAGAGVDIVVSQTNIVSGAPFRVTSATMTAPN